MLHLRLAPPPLFPRRPGPLGEKSMLCGVLGSFPSSPPTPRSRSRRTSIDTLEMYDTSPNDVVLLLVDLSSSNPDDG